jgi:multicomponent Na+:H+ antiporter subunit E
MNSLSEEGGGWLVACVLLVLLWGGMVDWDAGSWVIGAPCILLALYVSWRLRPLQPARLSLWRLPRFAAWFLWHSLRGGLDVARRALYPRMPLNPGFIRYRLALPEGAPRVFLVNCLSLLPGTLSACLEGDELVMHTLDTEGEVVPETRAAERQVGRLFNVTSGETDV